MNTPAAGYCEIEHTADWELKVWAPDLAGLFEQAARGLYALSHAQLAGDPRVKVRLEISALDQESLLVKFLSELLYLAEQDQVGFDDFRLNFEQVNDGDLLLKANLKGANLKALSKEIKAVTYHNLAIKPGVNGLETSIVLDV